MRSREGLQYPPRCPESGEEIWKEDPRTPIPPRFPGSKGLRHETSEAKAGQEGQSLGMLGHDFPSPREMGSEEQSGIQARDQAQRGQDLGWQLKQEGRGPGVGPRWGAWPKAGACSHKALASPRPATQ